MDDTPEVAGSEIDASQFQAILDAPEDTSVAPETEAAPPTEVSPEPKADGRDRDDLGRFKAQDQATAEAAKVPSAVPPESAAPQTPEAAKAPDEAQAVPFYIKYGNREHDVLPGAVITPHGLVIPTEQVQQVHTLVGRALKYEAERQTLREQELRTRQAEQHWTSKAETFGPAIDQSFSMAAMPERTDQEVEAKMLAAYEFVTQLGRERPILKQREQLARERVELQLQREMARPDPETSRAQIVESVVSTADEHLAQTTQHLSVLTSEDAEVLRQRVKDDPERYAYRVGPRLTEEELAAGFKPGELAFDGRVLYRDAGVIAKYRERETQARKQAEEAVKAAQRNATTVAVANGVPPAPTTTTPPAPPSKKAAKPADPEDWDDWYDKNIAAGLRAAVA